MPENDKPVFSSGDLTSVGSDCSEGKHKLAREVADQSNREGHIVFLSAENPDGTITSEQVPSD